MPRESSSPFRKTAREDAAQIVAEVEYHYAVLTAENRALRRALRDRGYVQPSKPEGSDLKNAIELLEQLSRADQRLSRFNCGDFHRMAEAVRQAATRDAGEAFR